MPTMTFATKLLSPENFLNYVPGIQSAPVTPSDTVDMPINPGVAVIGLYSPTGGQVTVNLFGSTTGTAVVQLAPGVPVLIGAKRVLVTGTTATGILSLWATI